jgi:CBS domain-containing protein
LEQLSGKSLRTLIQTCGVPEFEAQWPIEKLRLIETERPEHPIRKAGTLYRFDRCIVGWRSIGPDGGNLEGEMTVKTILSNKGGNVTTTGPADTLESGMRILAEHGIGALVVLGADQRVIGVLSERDIVRALAERGPSALTEPLAQVMTRNVSTCSPSDTVKSIMKRMTVCKFRHLPVVEQEQLVGIVSIGDVVKHTLMEMRDESEALHDYTQTA